MANRTIDTFVNKIFVSDSLFLLPKIPSNSVDIIVTSPPYNFGKEYDVTNDDLDIHEYLKIMELIWVQCFRVLKTGGRLCVNIKPNYSKHVDTHHIFSEQIKRAGLLWRMEIVVDLENYNCSPTAWGSYKSPSSNYILFTHEFVEVFDKDVRKKPLDNVLSKTYDKAVLEDITEDEFKAWVKKGIWNIHPAAGMMKDYGHPAVFSEEIPERLMKLFSYVGDTVLDPFNGVGTTTKVAATLNRRFIGIDISEKYCRTAMNRVLSFQRNTSLVDDGMSVFFPLAKMVRVGR